LLRKGGQQLSRLGAEPPPPRRLPHMSSSVSPVIKKGYQDMSFFYMHPEAVISSAFEETCSSFLPGEFTASLYVTLANSYKSRCRE
jgi:hypothetical protein